MSSTITNPEFTEYALSSCVEDDTFDLAAYNLEDEQSGSALEQLLAPAKTTKQREMLIEHYKKMMQDVIDKNQWIEVPDLAKHLKEQLQALQERYERKQRE